MTAETCERRSLAVLRVTIRSARTVSARRRDGMQRGRHDQIRARGERAHDLERVFEICHRQSQGLSRCDGVGGRHFQKPKDFAEEVANGFVTPQAATEVVNIRQRVATRLSCG